jgi:signal transduction histidine kinase
VGGVPALVLLYALYIVLCISLSLDLLRHPGPTERVMGHLARQRARPWLAAASVALLLSSLLVAGVGLWIVLKVRQFTRTGVYTPLLVAVARMDLLIASLISLATLALGQAVVSYEVFAGKTLPRRGLRRYWRNAIILAAGFGLLVGWSLTYQLRAVYSLLLSTALMTTFYALLSWRSYVERERYIAHLRPFVSSQRLYERLLSPSAPPELDATRPFRALCADVLGTRLAYLAAVGPLAPLAGPPLAYPFTAPTPLPPLAELTAQFSSPQTMYAPLNPSRYGGATWAVPLWSERGLIGLLLLGEKLDGGLYTQEEIEIARASGERLIDTQASAEMARRLMALQRQRLSQGQVLDMRARRALHDDVLPRLHAAMLASPPLGGIEGGEDLITLLSDVHRQISDLLRDLPTSTAPQVARLGLVGALRQAVDEELGGAFDTLDWHIEPEVEQKARRIPSLTAEVLFYAAREAVRNAARHGRDETSSRPLRLDIAIHWREGLCILVEDNGVGIGTGETSKGQGLALHSTMMAVVGGSLALESVPGVYTRVSLMLPVIKDEGQSVSPRSKAKGETKDET